MSAVEAIALRISFVLLGSTFRAAPLEPKLPAEVAARMLATAMVAPDATERGL